MNRQSDKHLLKDQVPDESTPRKMRNSSLPPQPRYLLVAWILLLVLGALFIFGSISDLLADIM